MHRTFGIFAKAGSELATLHLGYETCEQYFDLNVERIGQKLQRSLFEAPEQEPKPEHFKLGTKAMQLVNEDSTLIINEHVRLTGIPPDAHKYVVNGKNASTMVY